jgi:hypothetical protein
MYVDFETYVLVRTCMCGAENHENVLLEYLPGIITYAVTAGQRRRKPTCQVTYSYY